jgi:hypothetical protein
VTGLNVPAKDPRALAHAIVRICADEELYGRFSINCLQRFRESFTIDMVVESMSRLYETVAKEERAGDAARQAHGASIPGCSGGYFSSFSCHETVLYYSVQ